MNRNITDVSTAPSETPAAQKVVGLSGSMGTFRLFALVMAFVSPLVTVAGWLVILIAYGGPAAPAMMLVAAVLVTIFSLGFVAMGHHMPNPGAFYSYVAASLGRVMGLGAGFVAVAVYILLGMSSFIFFGVAASNFVTGELHGPGISWYWYTLMLLVVVSVFGYLQVELSAKVLLVAMSLEIVVVLIFDLAIFAGGNVSEQGGVSLEPFSWMSLTGASWGLGLLFAILFFNGFEGTAAFREEVRDPARTIGRTTLMVVAFVGVFYCIASWAIVSYFGADKAVELASSDPVSMFTTALGASAGQWLVDVASILLLTSIFAASVSIYSILTRYLYSLGVDRVLPRQLGAVHPKHNSPHKASFAAGALFLVGVLPVMLGGADPSLIYGRLGGTGGYGYLLLFAVVSLAVLVYFWGRRGSHSVNVWVSVVAPAASLVAMSVLLIVGIMNFSTLTGGSGALAVILQAVVWGSGLTGIALGIFYRAKRPDIFARIGRRDVTETAQLS
ncbi:APC family permease [Mycobacterium sp. 21AC1]|uniref:APC family permease n=1 Tax=[Mycobacterium] appelbergii TaxID=2939269 RepID=UPI00293911C6|nr:APC family permease [Mycobacterium sp. 21AC1]MDV3126012.1 APC family permease [Mycobacterium sp. 21AC1]